MLPNYKIYELVNFALNQLHIFYNMGNLGEFQKVYLIIHEKMLPMQWNILVLYNMYILRRLRFKSSYEFWNAP